MLVTSMGLGLRACRQTQTWNTLAIKTTPVSSRSISYALASSSPKLHLSRNPPPTTASTAGSSFFTPSLCRTRRHASTAASQSPAQQVLDWNTFFRLRTSRRRYSLASSIVSSIASTGAMFVFLSTQPELADQITKLIPTDPFVSMGIATFGATLLGWLFGPIFGNAVWRLFHRARLPEFTIKERAFFERIKKHRVNPTGASTNNPVPDYYGEKIGSVSGYRRWLKDQRAFNRKREGTYTARV